MDSKKNCMFCGTLIPPPRSAGSRSEIACDVCGKYQVSEELLDDGPNIGDEGYLVSAWLWWSALDNKGVTQFFTQERAKQIARDAPRYRPREKMDQLLTAIGRITKRPGPSRELKGPKIMPMAWAVDEAEAGSYLVWLVTEELIHSGKSNYWLTLKGWERFEALQTSGQFNSRRAFVAMWFADEMDTVWEHGLKPGIEDAGFDPYRVKGVAHGERIDAHIIAELRTCRFVVADVTGERTAVYYEAGFAEGLGKPIIWTCDIKKKDHMSFDTRQFAHILWSDGANLREQLSAWIKARII